tara:strand:- start:5832 stop:6278 length:447 start_codon:yes stop_codon:yes gene_type:complete
MNVMQPDFRSIGTRCAAVRTLMTARSIARMYDQAMKPVGLTGTQFTLLVAIGSSDFKSISELGETLCIEKSTLSRNLKPLLEAGLLERVRSGGTRSVTHKLTEKGEDRLKDAIPLWDQAQSHIESEIGREDLKSGYRFLARLRQAARV